MLSWCTFWSSYSYIMCQIFDACIVTWIVLAATSTLLLSVFPFGELADSTWTHLVSVATHQPSPPLFTALSPEPGWYHLQHWLSLMQEFTHFSLITLHSSCSTNTPHPHPHPTPNPCFPPFLHMKEANHRCDLPFFTSDPANTRITTSIPAPPTPRRFPQLGGCFSPGRWQMRGQGAVRPPC